MFNQLKSVSLFSGIAGIRFGTPLLYCEINKHCRRVLNARMDDGSLQRAPIHDDVQSLETLPAGTELLLAGFPCQNLSCAGNQDGIHGTKSQLFFEVVRLARKSRPKYVFLENVSNLRFIPESWQTVLAEMNSIGYDCRWITVSAEQCGAPHKRHRWFCLCTLERPAADDVAALDFAGETKMYSNGELIEGMYSETKSIHAGFPSNLELVLLPLRGPRPTTQSTNLVIHPIQRRRWATIRSTGGNHPPNVLTKRSSHDLGGQLRYEQNTPEKLRWLDHCRPNAAWVDTYMGFPKNWSDWSTPLDSMEHSFAEDGSVPRLIVSNIPNSWRLRLLGNACCPQQSIFAMENLWSRSNVLDVPSFLQEMRPVSPSAFELSRKRRRVVDTSIVMTRK
jgi:site-specific DNA-cytosine methylase